MHSSPSQPARWFTQHKSPLALACVFLTYFALNAVAPYIADPDEEEQRFVWACVCGAVMLQPMMVGAWTALARGSILTRLPFVLPCLMLLFLAPVFKSSVFADLPRFDYIVTVAGGFAMFLLTLLVFLWVRWFFRVRIESQTHEELIGPASLRFSIKHVLALTSLYAVMFAMISQVRFHPNPPPSFLGPSFLIFVMIISIPMCLAVSSPILTAPLLLLYRGPRRSAVARAILFWFVVCMLAIIVTMAMDPESFPDSIGMIFCVHAGGLDIGILSALPLRFAGIELVKTEPANAKSVPQDSIQ